MSMFSVRMAALAALVGCALGAGAANAQVYRIVGPDGRVTFSDRPPPDGKATPAQTVPLGAAAGSVATASLPSEVRNAATRYPVTLYTGKDCAPCDQARTFLTSRGVPFTEKTVSTEADLRALRNVSGATNLPFATLGAQHLVGFSDSQWSQYMDAAGYPKTSVLPPNYRNPAPAPLVAVETPRTEEPTAQAPARAPAREQPPQPMPSDPSPANPAGIRF
jgi:glutaredoxin